MYKITARLVAVKTLNNYLEQQIYPALEARRFSVVYFHTGVTRAENFPGISALKSIYDVVPPQILANMDAFYFLHPGIQSRLFLATVGRFIFSAAAAGKIKYLNRLEFLWDKVRRGMEVPEFVQEYDDDTMESRPIVDYGMEGDHPRMLCTAAYIPDSCALTTYSTRCIA